MITPTRRYQPHNPAPRRPFYLEPPKTRSTLPESSVRAFWLTFLSGLFFGASIAAYFFHK